jgi:hypothetical protein
LWKPDSFFYGCFFDDLFYVHLLSCHKWSEKIWRSQVVFFLFLCIWMDWSQKLKDHRGPSLRSGPSQQKAN